MAKKKTINKDFLISLYSTMIKIRKFEEEGTKLYRQGHIRGYFHPYWGQEAIASGILSAMNKDDYVTSTHRGHGHCLAWGADLVRMFSELLGREDGYCKGLGGSMHIADYTKNNLGANGIVGSCVPIAVGAALGIKIRDENKVVTTFVSDGGCNIGSFLEGLNLASAWKLPVLFVIENNQYAVSTPIESSTGETDLFKRGLSFGIEGIRINGNDVLEVYETANKYIDYCGKNSYPYIIECLTFRKSGHHINDPGTYLPEDKVNFYRNNDPLNIGKKHLTKLAGLSDEEINNIEQETDKVIEEALKVALDKPEMEAKDFLRLVDEY